MEETKKLKITFCSGAGLVTGANFLLESPEKRILVDCGMIQGSKVADDENWNPFPYDPSSIDVLFITHAHLDHIGRIPKLIHEGFKGIIYSTPPTKALAKIMLEDTDQILSHDTVHNLSDFYNEQVLLQAMDMWQTLEYHHDLDLGAGFTVSLKDAGHILGSAMVKFTYNGKRILFTGDLGNSPSPLIRNTEMIADIDYLIMESVYGDRNHESRSERRTMLQEVIQDNHKKQGTLVMPTFSLERTQELLFEINNLIENERIPVMPIFLDSPLAIRLTAIYKEYEQGYFNETAKAVINGGDDIFTFPGLKITLKTEQSKEILTTPDPKIVIAGSGMSSGGRVVHHEHNYLPDPKNTILLTGYQTPGTLGWMLQEGNKDVRIAGEVVPVRAKIITIEGYSGHKDSDALLAFVQDDAAAVKKVFVVMGEPKSSLFLVQKLRDNLAIDASAPNAGDVVEIEC
jgi:metallo-beta-lactamase family protein